MGEGRFALVIASWEYAADPGLSKLVAPPQDADALARVLRDPQIGAFEVQTLLNETSSRVVEEVEAFFAERQRADLALLYFSGHGVKDSDGQLYFAMPNTRRDRLRSTALKAQEVNEIMRGSKAQQKLLLLDCCYSGAFARGTIFKADQSIGTRGYFESRGLAILTASDALQYSFEEEEVAGQATQSVFTRLLTQGLGRGEADTDSDGLITFDELYDYISDRIEQTAPHQQPRKWAVDLQGKIVIARNPHPVLKPAALPDELQQTLEDYRSWVREGAVRELARLLEGKDPGLALAAQEALKRLVDDDSRRVANAASEILTSYEARQPRAEPEPQAGEETGQSDQIPGPDQPGPETKDVEQTTEIDRTGREEAKHGPHVLKTEKQTGLPPGTGRNPRQGPERHVPKTKKRTGLPAKPDKKSLLISKLAGHTGAVRSVAFSPDGKLLASGSQDNTVRLWRVADGELVRTFTGHTGHVFSVSISPDGTLLASASWDGTVRLWRVSNGKAVRTLTGHTDLLLSVAFSPDGRLLASGSRDKTARLWRVADGELVRTFAGHTNYVCSVSISPDGSLLASGSTDGTVRSWRVADGAAVRTLTGHTNQVLCVAFSPDGKLVASGSKDNTMRLWQVSNGAAVRTLVGHTKQVNAVAFSPDGNLLASGSNDQTARLWRVRDGKQLDRLTGQTDAVNGVAFSPDGSLLASGSGGYWIAGDSTVRLWRLPAEQT
jgi:WD40 repeat protein